MGKIGSTILTFLFSIPVTAVGFMAVFGVPPIAALNASPKNDDVVIRDPFDQDHWNDSSQVLNSAQDAPPYEGIRNGDQSPSGHIYTGNDLSAPTGRPNFFSNEQPRPDSNTFNNSPASASPNSQPLSNSRQFPNQPLSSGQPLSTDGNRYAMNSETNTPPLSDENTPVNGMRNPFGENASNAVRPNTTETSAQMLNWQEASARLAELGIRKYHLERGGDEGMFMFVCLYHPSATPQVTHRFEAEGNDPLVAVNQVISQVDGWLQKQFQETHKYTGVSFTR